MLTLSMRNKLHFLIIFVYLIRFCQNNCTPSATKTIFANKDLISVEKNIKTCFTGTDLKVDYFAVYNGFIRDEEILNTMKCTTAASELCVTMSELYQYIIISKQNTTESMMIIFSVILTSILGGRNLAKYEYYKNEFECFTATLASLQEFEAMEASLNGKLYFKKDKTNYCFLFNHNNEVKTTLMIENQSILVHGKVRTVKSSSVIKAMKNCEENDSEFSMDVVNKLIVVLDVDQDKFCVDPTKHILDKIYRNNVADKRQSFSSYCKKELNTKYCIKVQNDFLHATFHPVNADRKMIVVSHESANYSKYFTVAPTGTEFSFWRLGCSDSSKYTNKETLFRGYYEKSDNKVCILSAENPNNFSATFKNEGTDVTYKHYGCFMDNTKVLLHERIVKHLTTYTPMCIPKRYTVVEHIQRPTFLFDKFIEMEASICVSNHPKAQCYYLNNQAKFAVISNEIDESRILIYREDIAENPTGIAEYIYDTTYFKDEIVCVKKTQVTSWSSVINKKYVVYDANKACFLPELMDQIEEIQIKSIYSCDVKIITVNSTISKPASVTRLGQTACNDIKDLKATTTEISVRDIATTATLSKCLEATCLKLSYSFEIPTTGTNNLVYKIKECTEETDTCLAGTEGKYVVFQVEDPITKKRNIFKITTTTTLTLTYTENTFIYGSNYYMNDVVCFQNDKTEGDEPNRKFPIKSNEISCAIVRDLSEDVSVIVDTFDSCKRVVHLLHNTPSPYIQPNKPPEIECNLIFTENTTKFHKVTANLLWQCISLTCATITHFSDFSQSPTAISHLLIACETPAGSENSCNVHRGKEGLAIITSGRFDGNKILYTRDLNIAIPDSEFYQKYYDESDVVFLPKLKVTTDDKTKLADSYVEGNSVMLVVPKLLSEQQNINLALRTGCSREITFNKVKNENEKNSQNAINVECLKFTLQTGQQKQIIVDSISHVKECTTNMCLEKLILVKDDESVIPCSDQTTCALSVTGLKYYKVKSQYNEKEFYIITDQMYKTKVTSLGVDSFFSSHYFISDIFCIKTDLLIDAQSSDLNGIFTTDDAKTCYIVNEITSTDRALSIKMKDQCNYRVVLKKSASTANGNVELVNANLKCQIFIDKATDINAPLVKSPADLKECIKTLCLTPLFVTIRTQISDYRGKVVYCDQYPDECESALDIYDYAKIRNDYTSQNLYIKNPGQTGASVREASFISSPLYKDEVICINEGYLQKDSFYTISNLYTLENRKCIIIGEMEASNHITVTTMSQCRRTIRTETQLSLSTSSVRDVDDAICGLFLVPRDDGEQIYSIKLKNLKNCLIHTCSSIVSKIELQEKNKPFVHSKITPCDITKSISDCLPDHLTYDFVQVTNNYINGNKYFRTYESSDLSSYIQKRFVFYDKEYYNDDVVCFFTNALKPIGDAKKRSEKAALFIEDDRICILANRLESDFDVEYIVTGSCNLIIKIKKDPKSSVDEATTQNPRSLCSEFFTKSHQVQNLVKYTKEKLLTCLEKTCSKVVQFVKLETANLDYQVKSLKICTDTETNTECLNGVTYFEAMKIKSPFLQGHLYLQSEGIKTSSLDFYKDKLYKNQYFANEVVCVHMNLIVSTGLIIDSERIFTNKDVTCFIPKHFDTNFNLQIRMFGKCLKNITLVNAVAVVQVPAVTDVCAPLYTTSSSSDPAKMNLDVLRNCIFETCSLLSYYISENLLQEKHVKKFNNCGGAYGDDSCIRDQTTYVMAKVTNTALSNPIYILSDPFTNLQDSDFDNLFYEKEYFKDEVLCGLRNKITVNGGDGISLLPLDTQSHVCIIIKELTATKQISIMLKENCNKPVTLNHVNERNGVKDVLDKKCEMFYKNELQQQQKSLPIVSVADIKSCVTHTCSKIDKYLEKTTATEQNPTLQIGTDAFGNANSIKSNTDYDLIKIVNSYLSKPLYLRSYDSDATTSEKSKATFGKSVYTGNDITCYLKSNISNSADVISEEGVINTESKMCIIVPELVKKIEIKLKVTESCHRTIYMQKNPANDLNPQIAAKDTDCSEYSQDTTGSKKIIIAEKDAFLKCASHTCSSFLYPKNAHNSKLCSSKSSVKQCENDDQYTFAIVKSPYKTDPFLTMSQESKKEWSEKFIDPKKYEIFYTADEIFCFNKDIITIGENSRKYSETTTQYCYEFDSADKEYVLTIQQNSGSTLTYIGTKDTPAPIITSTKLKIEFYGVNQETNLINIGFKYETKFDSSENAKGFAEIGDLEECASENKQESTFTSVDNNTNFDNHGIAISVNENMIFKRPFVFLLEEEKGCVGYYIGDEPISNVKQSLGENNNIVMNNHECIYLVEEYLTITLNSKHDKKRMSSSEDQSCLSHQQLNDSCKYIHDLNQHLTICFRGRKDVESASQESKNAIYIMAKKGACYHHKIILWQRVSFCEITNGELLMRTFDWKMMVMKGSEKRLKFPKSAAAIGSGISIGFGALCVLIVVVFIMGRLSKQNPNNNPI